MKRNAPRLSRFFSDFIAGAGDAVPVAFAFFFLFAAVGALAKQHHYSFLQASMMTMLVFAAPLQATLMQLTGPTVSYFGVLSITAIVNFRFIFMSATLLPYFKHTTYFKLLLISPLLSASTFAVSYTKFKNSPSLNCYYYHLGVAITSYLTALASTMLGYLLSQGLSSTYFSLLLSFILPIHFTALAALNWPKLLPIAAIFLGFLLTPVINSIIPNWGILFSPLMSGLLIFSVELLLKWHTYEKRSV